MLEINNIVFDKDYYVIYQVEETIATGRKILTSSFETPGRAVTKNFDRETVALSAQDLVEIIERVKKNIKVLSVKILSYSDDPLVPAEDVVEKSSESAVENSDSEILLENMETAESTTPSVVQIETGTVFTPSFENNSSGMSADTAAFIASVVNNVQTAQSE